MSDPNENPPIPDSLAAEGIQGADAKASGPSELQDSRLPLRTRDYLLVRLIAAWVAFQVYALQTDSPEPGIPEAADLLDAAIVAILKGGAP